ncbi:MAG: DUF3332 domain-containing protein [Bacteroidales bacterium]|jgi:hypothetical protein|nr:DUF3332 domain-containing protein [Bacteroidales bacterium]
MKTKAITKLVAIALASSILFQSCLGSFKLFNKVIEWNQNLTVNKFINNLVYWVLNIVPVYGVVMFIDAIILNTIEFWTDSNPIAYNSQEIETENGVFLVETTPAGHKITNKETNEVVSFLFNETEKSWSVETKDGVQPLFVCVNNTHVQMPNGSVVALTEAGLYAFKNVIENQRNLAVK